MVGMNRNIRVSLTGSLVLAVVLQNHRSGVRLRL
nr:MAG TPA: hypothetical protein [Caudoviricetes sp.]